MGLSNYLSCEAESFSHCRNPHRFLQPEVLRLSFPTGTLGCMAILLPSCSSQFICTQLWDHPVHQPPPCHVSSSPKLPNPTPPTNLNECFFFNSLVFGLPYSFIFWQFWLFFVFKFVVVLLLVVPGAKAYLPMPPSWLEV